jgi:hypothetical protein
MTNNQSKMGQMAVCCQNLTLDVLSSHSALSVLVGALFKKFGFFEHTLCISFTPPNFFLSCPTGCYYRITKHLKSPMSITIRYDSHTQFSAQLHHHHV